MTTSAIENLYGNSLNGLNDGDTHELYKALLEGYEQGELKVEEDENGELLFSLFEAEDN